MDVGEPARSAVVVKCEPFVVEAEQMKDRGVKVVNVDDVFNGLIAELVRRPECETIASRRHRPARL